MRAMLWMGSVVAALAVAIGAGRLWAENKEQKPAKVEKAAAPRTRIAFVNLTYVIKNYDKYKQFQDEIKKAIVPFQRTEQHLRQKAEALRKRFEEATNAADPMAREEYESQAKELRRKKENLDEKAKKAIAKKSDEGMKILYLDVEEVAKRYAIAHDFDLLLHYNDATNQEDLDSTQNIGRKLNTGALMPVYAVPGMNISKDLVKLLNQSVKND